MNDVHYEVRDQVAEIGLDHPPANALTEPMIDRLLHALQRAADDEGVRAVIVHGRVPGRFCAGLDLKRLQGASPESVRTLLDKLYPALTEAQHRLGKPSIAAVEGSARGGGMTLAISCDLIVASRTSTFGYPEIDLGVLPAIHFTHLPRVVGRYRAFDLLFTGRSFDAAEAQALGLVSRVVDEGAALAEARALARVFASKAPGAMRIGHAAFHAATDHGYRQGVAGAVDLFCHVAVAAEGREGVAAFADKRPPGWQREPG
ncbi:MAG: enoyl-CoA hydratase/isomerase family protein [Rubrivivax sp.]